MISSNFALSFINIVYLFLSLFSLSMILYLQPTNIINLNVSNEIQQFSGIEFANFQYRHVQIKFCILHTRIINTIQNLFHNEYFLKYCSAKLSFQNFNIHIIKSKTKTWTKNILNDEYWNAAQKNIKKSVRFWRSVHLVGEIFLRGNHRPEFREYCEKTR